MDVDLTKEDLINLVKGTCPNYNVMDSMIERKLGHYTGGFRDDWTWDRLGHLTEEELIEVYNTCKNSWNNGISLLENRK